jgi:hypothetical protein
MYTTRGAAEAVRAAEVKRRRDLKFMRRAIEKASK